MDELLTMSKKELTRLEVIQRVEQKRLKQKEAAEILGISTRQVRREISSNVVDQEGLCQVFCVNAPHEIDSG